MTIWTAPDAIDALVAAWRAALPDVKVIDGMPLTEETRMLCVGFTGEPSEPAVETTLARDGADLGPDREQYTIACVVWVRKGGTNAKSVRDIAYALVAAARQTLTSDPTLSGTVGRTRMATQELTQEQDSKGAFVELRFSVAVDAFTR